MNKELYDLLVTAAADYRARGDEAAAARIEHSLRSYREQEPQISRETFEKNNPPPQGVSFDETLNHYMCGSSGSLHARDSYQLLWAAWQVRVALERADAAELKLAASDYAYDSARNHDRLLVNELDVLLNGKGGADEQANLSDLVEQVAGVVKENGRPLLQMLQPGGGVDQLHVLDKQCRDDVARALGLTPHGDGYAWSALLADIKTAAKIAQAGPEPMEWRTALERLEQACEVRAALTSSEAYAHTAEASPAVVALLRNIVEGEVGRWNLSKLDDGQGTDTEDGRNWLAARGFVRGLPGSMLQAPLPKSVRAWYDAKLAHINAVEAYNTRLAYVRQHLPFGASVDPEYQLMEKADRNARSLVGPMFEELRGLIGEGGLPAASAGEEVMRGLAAFAQEMIKGALEGGSFDGGDIQGSAERHGVLTKEVMTRSCAGPEGDCPCAWNAGFPAECYRINPAVLALVGGEAAKARHVENSDSGRIN